MRIALLSDLHANLRALRACLAHARAQGVTRFALLGDLVGYGAEPAQVVEECMALVAQGALAIKGNHDELAVSGGPAFARNETWAEASASWTRHHLEPVHREFLHQLPLTATVGEALLVHASADLPAAWHYTDNAPRAASSLEAAKALSGARCVFSGHVHHQRLWYLGRGTQMLPFTPEPGVPVPLLASRRWLATVGAVGQPRDGDPRAAYAVWETEPQPRLTFFRVPYDHGAAAQAVRESGLPDRFARQLEEGR